MPTHGKRARGFVRRAARQFDLVVLDPPEEDRFYNYPWPYSFTDLMYTSWNVYQGVKHVHLYFNGLAPGAQATCWVGRIEALEESPLVLASPALIVSAFIIAYYAQLIAPTPGEAGAMEFALLGVLVGLGVPALQAAAMTLLFRFISFWLPIPVGVLCYFNLKRQGKI